MAGYPEASKLTTCKSLPSLLITFTGFEQLDCRSRGETCVATERIEYSRIGENPGHVVSAFVDRR